EEPTGPEPDPQLDRAITDLKVKFIELERELVQLRELISQQPAQDTRVQQDSSAISTELTKLRQDRDSNRRELSTVRTEVRELQQDRESHMARLTALTEEVRELREERRSYRRELTALSEELQERERVKEQLDSHPDHNQNPMNTTPSPQTNTTPHPSRPAQQRGKPDIVILIDSNGKFIDENKLFPTHTVAKIWCPNTQHAMDLLSEQQLGSPSHIIIHTGSNDLRSQQERVSESLRGVIEKASTTFPNSRVERPPPDTIHRINSNMSRDCILRPNVHLAHHPTLDINCLYDHVHLYKNTVPIFARTLKDVALNRDQSTPRRRSSPAQNPLRPERHPTGPPPRQHPWRQDHPHLLPHHAPLRSHQGSYDYPQARPEPLLSPGVPPQPQRRELHPDPLSYAQAVKRTAGPTLTTTTHVPEPTHTPPHDELRDIQQMLSLLCSHLIGQVPQ
ncbi:Myosin-1, partial [Dissostichus eleginoides]